MATVLITGGAGGIGRELAGALSAGGHTVRALDLPMCDFTALEAMRGVEAVRGDILDRDLLRRAAAGVDAAVHLAALLPPASERDWETTWRVNVQGTRLLVEALREAGRRPHLVLSSSVCVYGDTESARPRPGRIEADRASAPYDLYGESKVAAEALACVSELPWTILRISGVSVPAFLAPPSPWPFRAEQRIEFVARADVVSALAACVGNGDVVGRTLHVAGGPTWQMTGGAYVARFNQALGLEAEDAAYCPGPCAFGWYDTADAQAALGYQNTSFAAFMAQLDAAVEAALG